MTKSQIKVFNRLNRLSGKRLDVRVVESSDRSVVIYVPFPGFYLTYDQLGTLIRTQTIPEREKSGESLARADGKCLVIEGGLDEGRYNQKGNPDLSVGDDDVPF